VDPARLRWETLIYPTDLSLEYFLSAVTPGGRLAGFLRLSLPKRRGQVPLTLRSSLESIVDEIANCAMIRQVHTYGPALAVGADRDDEAQHAGIGQRLVEQAQQIARASGYQRLAVIAATGTRNYYRRLGFELGELYMALNL
jgi:elongator complex protein 3